MEEKEKRFLIFRYLLSEANVFEFGYMENPTANANKRFIT